MIKANLSNASGFLEVLTSSYFNTLAPSCSKGDNDI